jgi:hypothetical protein
VYASLSFEDVCCCTALLLSGRDLFPQAGPSPNVHTVAE